MKRRKRIAISCTVVAAFAIVLVLAHWWSEPAPLTLRFLYYTNVTGQRTAMMELSNRTDVAYEWIFHSRAKAINHRVGITTVRPSSEDEFYNVTIDGSNLFGRDTIQFGTDDFRVGEQFWVEVKRYPKSASDLRRERLSGWIYGRGLRSIAPHVEIGQRIDGPVLPPDNL